MEELSLTNIRSLDKNGIINLYNKLGIPFPPEADLEYLRSKFRLIKLRSTTDGYNTQSEGYVVPVNLYDPVTFYNNQEIIAHELLNNTNSDNIYEDVYEPQTYASLGE